MFSKKELLAGLRRAREQEDGKNYFTFEINIYELLGDVIRYLENDNPPLKFEELETGEWYWDNICEEWCLYIKSCNCFRYISGTYKFEENRFYRKQVE